MLVVTGNRGSGKTTKALDWLRQDPLRRLIVHSAQEAQRLRRLGSASGVPPELSTRISALQDTVVLGRDVVLGIDNLDLVLPTLLYSRPVEFVTVTGTTELLHGGEVVL